MLDLDCVLIPAGGKLRELFIEGSEEEEVKEPDVIGGVDIETMS